MESIHCYFLTPKLSLGFPPTAKQADISRETCAESAVLRPMNYKWPRLFRSPEQVLGTMETRLHEKCEKSDIMTWDSYMLQEEAV